MSIRGIIRRLDRGPLGTEEEVIHHLREAFPGVRFAYQGAESPGSASARELMPLYLRLWLAVFGTETRYPNHRGYFESAHGGAVEFYFPAAQTVGSIEATSYGMTAGLDDNFRRLSAATGWVVNYPRF